MTGAADGGAAAGGEVSAAWHSTADVEVPGRDFTLSGLQPAQALGGLGALRRRGRPAIRVHLRDRAAGVSQLPGSARASTNGAAR